MSAIGNQVRYELFQFEGTDNVRSLILWIDENFFDSSTSVTLLTPLSSFLSTLDIPKGKAAEKFGTWVYTGQLSRQNGALRFGFGPARTAEQLATVVYTETKWVNMSWPDVLVGLTYGDFEAYDSNGDAYIADTVWEPDFKTYQGTTKVVTEYFLNHRTFNTADAWVTTTSYIVGARVLQSGVVYRCLTAHTSGTFATDLAAAKWINDWALESPQPQPINFYYGVGKLQIRPCLHPLLNLSWTTGTPNPRYPYQTFAQSYVATNYTDWPLSMRIANSESYVNGMFLRQISTAYRPFS